MQILLSRLVAVLFSIAVVGGITAPSAVTAATAAGPGHTAASANHVDEDEWGWQ